MGKHSAVGKNENDVVQSTPLKSRGGEQGQLKFDAQNREKTSGLIAYIHRNPSWFIFDPKIAASLFTDSDFEAAHAFFSEPNPDRYVFAVCSALFHRRCPNLDLRLYASGMSEYRESRFWPFWYAGELETPEAMTADAIESYLLNLWNSPAKEPWTPGLFYQTGFLEIEEFQPIEGFLFFKCALPVRRSGEQKPDTITFAFDSGTKSFYTINARVRFAESEHRFRFVEFIKPDASPPEVRKFLAPGNPQKWKVLAVLDRHIGDTLSLFSTHLAYLSKVAQFDLTLDASMCPLFQKAPTELIKRFLPGANVNVLELPADRSDYDLVFDPYDWLSDMFDLKPQNDSGVSSIVSGLEYGRCYLHEKRRDILDMHMNALKRMGLAPLHAHIPEFVRYRISSQERMSARQKKRRALLGDSFGNELVKIVSIFPYGLAADRRYPVESLRTAISLLLENPNVRVFIAGTDEDTPEMALTIRGDWWNTSKNRIRMFSHESLANLIDLMLASDAVVSMDSGPLHLARSLRINPIGLYTSKANGDDKSLVSFPWLVEDSTVVVLKPNKGDWHVFPDRLVSTIQKKLKDSSR